jgi:hypothetical protein
LQQRCGTTLPLLSSRTSLVVVKSKNIQKAQQEKSVSSGKVAEMDRLNVPQISDYPSEHSTITAYHIYALRLSGIRLLLLRIGEPSTKS